MAGGRPWTKKEIEILLSMAGEFPTHMIANRLPGRTRMAARQKLSDLGFSAVQGSWSLQRLLRESGYNLPQIQRAKKATGQAWKRDGFRWWISDTQAQELLDYLGKQEPVFVTRQGFQRHYWSRKYERCVKCRTNGTKPGQRHKARGLCAACYARTFENQSPPDRRSDPRAWAEWMAKKKARKAIRRKQARERMRRLRATNPEYREKMRAYDREYKRMVRMRSDRNAKVPDGPDQRPAPADAGRGGAPPGGGLCA